ncbi:hypothetical protein T484DRAFT_1837780 [Baffinella frigidus]|nr:hypothetical protein T484DRAFT_1837780 [Cryptophyta sp. CCMP2293]
MAAGRWRWALLACILAVAVAPRQAAARESVTGSDSTGDGYLDASWNNMWSSIRGEKQKDTEKDEEDKTKEKDDLRRSQDAAQASHTSIMQKAEKELSSYSGILSALAPWFTP